MTGVVGIPSADLERYRSLVATIDLSAEQKDEVIQIVSSIMQAFVDQAFGVDATQLSQKINIFGSFLEPSRYANLCKSRKSGLRDYVPEPELGEIEP